MSSSYGPYDEQRKIGHMRRVKKYSYTQPAESAQCPRMNDNDWLEFFI